MSTLITNLATNPSFETAGSAVTVRTNLVPNPSAEVDVAGWGSVNGTLARYATTSSWTAPGRAVGTGMFLVTSSGTNSLIYLRSNTAVAERYVVAPGEWIAARGWGAHDGGIAGGMRLAIIFYDAAGSPVGNPSTPYEVSTFYVGKVREIVAQAPATAATYVLEWRGYSGSAAIITSGLRMWADAMVASNHPTEAAAQRAIAEGYFDGSTPAAGDFTYAWTGTADASASVKRGLQIAGTGAGEAVQSSEWASTGTRSMRMIASTQGDAWIDLASSSIPLGLVRGKTYTLSGKVRLTRALSQGPGFSLGGTSYRFPATPGVHAGSLTFTVPTSGDWFLNVLSGSDVVPAESWFDDFMLTEGTAVSDYKDGSFPGWVWNGTPNASTSTGPAQPYVNDATLTLSDGRTVLLDQVADFTETAESASVVQTTLNSTGSRHFAIVRPAGPDTGTITLHFTRELGEGEPGARAEAVAASLKTGAPHTIQYNADISGLAPITFVPTGTVERRLEVETAHRKRQSVWTVTVAYTRLEA